jgi:hypothetical protein
LQILFATHVSEPILVFDPNTQYKKNQTFSANGWVKYDNHPVSDVLVLLRLTNSDSDEIFRDEIRSDSNGNFTSKINLGELNLTEAGEYRITAESQCSDAHRSICNHNLTSQIVQIIN